MDNDDDDDGDDSPRAAVARVEENAIVDVVNRGVASTKENDDAPTSGRIFAKKGDVSALDVDDLRSELQLRQLDDTGNKGALVARLWEAVNPANLNTDPRTGNDTSVKVSLHRLLRTLFYLFYRFDGKAAGWDGGGDVRARVIEHAQRAFWIDRRRGIDRLLAQVAVNDSRSALGLDRVDFDDDGGPGAVDVDEALGRACDASSFFLGFWRFFDGELRIAVVPFEKWVDGDARPFLRHFEHNVMQVFAADKPEIQKVMTLLFERFLYYQTDHRDIILTFAHNCARMDEEPIESHNASVGQYTSPRQVYTIETYRKTSCCVTAFRHLTAQLDQRPPVCIVE